MSYIIMATQETGEEIRVGSGNYASYDEAYAALQSAYIPEEWGGAWIEQTTDYSMAGAFDDDEGYYDPYNDEEEYEEDL